MLFDGNGFVVSNAVAAVSEIQNSRYVNELIPNFSSNACSFVLF